MNGNGWLPVILHAKREDAQEGPMKRPTAAKTCPSPFTFPLKSANVLLLIRTMEDVKLMRRVRMQSMVAKRTTNHRTYSEYLEERRPKWEWY